MGSSTLAIIEITDKKNLDAFKVRSIIQNVLKDIEGEQHRFQEGRLRSAASSRFMLEDGYFLTLFNNKDVKRQMFVFLNCHCDYLQLCKEKIVLSLGPFDNGAQLMRKFAEAFKGYDGRIWFLEDDTVSENFEEIK